MVPGLLLQRRGCLRHHGHRNTPVGLARLRGGRMLRPAPELGPAGGHPGGLTHHLPSPPPHPMAPGSAKQLGLPRTEKNHQQQIFYFQLPAESVPVVLASWAAAALAGESLAGGGHGHGGPSRMLYSPHATPPPGQLGGIEGFAPGLCTRWVMVVGRGTGRGAGGHRSVSGLAPAPYLAPRSRRKRRAAFLFPEPPRAGRLRGRPRATGWGAVPAALPRHGTA